MTADLSNGAHDHAHVTVTQVTDVVEVIDAVEVVETVNPDGDIERAVVGVEHDEREVIAAEIREVDLGIDEERVATQGALPLDVRTGDAGVDAAVSQLRDLDDRPVAEHAEVFTAVHRALQDALVDLDRS